MCDPQTYSPPLLHLCPPSQENIYFRSTTPTIKKHLAILYWIPSFVQLLGQRSCCFFQTKIYFGGCRTLIKPLYTSNVIYFFNKAFCWDKEYTNLHRILNCTVPNGNEVGGTTRGSDCICNNILSIKNILCIFLPPYLPNSLEKGKRSGPAYEIPPLLIL